LGFYGDPIVISWPRAQISRIISPTSLCLQDLRIHRITTSIMHLAAVATLFALASVAMAGNPRYKVSCDPAVPAAYQASMKAFEKKNCGESEYFGRPGTWHEETQSCEAPGPGGTNTQRYYHPLFASSSGGPNISPRCHWVPA
ncbi:hypothetical protein CABS01_14649, partial [Colletotrichum abscissum]|uniref:uncharacterized protein n=1 Tax=Colletotrichum abscissum TaxID=1671311 RepID=UPI0027D5DB48